MLIREKYVGSDFLKFSAQEENASRKNSALTRVTAANSAFFFFDPPNGILHLLFILYPVLSEPFNALDLPLSEREKLSWVCRRSHGGNNSEPKASNDGKSMTI